MDLNISEGHFVQRDVVGGYYPLPAKQDQQSMVNLGAVKFTAPWRDRSNGVVLPEQRRHAIPGPSSLDAFAPSRNNAAQLPQDFIKAFKTRECLEGCGDGKACLWPGGSIWKPAALPRSCEILVRTAV